MKLYFLVHHLEPSHNIGNVVVRFIEGDGSQVLETVPWPSTSERWNVNVISFTLDETRDKSIEIKLLSEDRTQEIATLPLPLSIVPFDFRVNAKFLMDPLLDNDCSVKIFLMIHLSTFGQLPFHAKKGSLVRHLKDATRKKIREPAVDYPQERQLMMQLNKGLDELPSVTRGQCHSDPERFEAEGMRSLLDPGELEWAL